MGELDLGKQSYAHWAVQNDSPTAVTGPFIVRLLVDGAMRDEVKVENLGSQELSRQINLPFSNVVWSIKRLGCWRAFGGWSGGSVVVHILHTL